MTTAEDNIRLTNLEDRQNKLEESNRRIAESLIQVIEQQKTLFNNITEIKESTNVNAKANIELDKNMTKLSNSIDNLVKSQEKFNKYMENQQSKGNNRWDNVINVIITLAVSFLFNYFTKK